MGLHLNYELRLPEAATAEEVEAALVRLREFALALSFKSVTEIYRPEPGLFDSRRGGLRFLASVIAKAACTHPFLGTLVLNNSRWGKTSSVLL